MPESMLIICTLLVLFLLCTSGLLYILMALELNRNGKPTKFLSVSFNLRARCRIVKEVFENYRNLKRDENKFPLLSRVFYISVGLTVLFVILTFVTLASQ